MATETMTGFPRAQGASAESGTGRSAFEPKPASCPQAGTGHPRFDQ